MKFLRSEGELKQLQALPLEVKEQKALRRIEEYLDVYGTDGTYISFSGGKDSIVLDHLIQRVTGSSHAVERVYLDTFMEYPKMRSFVKENYQVTVIKPAQTPKKMILGENGVGWAFPSKDVSQIIYYARRGRKWALNKLHGLTKDGEYSEYRQRYKKFLPVYERRDIVISPFCCVKQKEEPVLEFERLTGKHPFIGTRASESRRRTEAWMRVGGCNSFDTRITVNEDGEEEEIIVDRPQSKPISIFSEQDILHYIVKYNLALPSPYGEIYEVGRCVGQEDLFTKMGMCHGYDGCMLKTSGEQRTGCIFCPIGCHLDNFAKFKRLRKAEPKLYDFCMEELHEKELLEMVQSIFGGNIYK